MSAAYGRSTYRIPAQAAAEVTAPKPVTWHEVGCPHCEALSWTVCRTPLGRLRMTPHVRLARVAAAIESPTAADALLGDLAAVLVDLDERPATQAPSVPDLHGMSGVAA